MGTHPSIASNRDGKDLTEAEDVKKMGKEYTEEQKKMQKSKMASKEAFKIAVKRREVKEKRKDIPTFEYRIPKNSKEK